MPNTSPANAHPRSFEGYECSAAMASSSFFHSAATCAFSSSMPQSAPSLPWQQAQSRTATTLHNSGEVLDQQTWTTQLVLPSGKSSGQETWTTQLVRPSGEIQRPGNLDNSTCPLFCRYRGQETWTTQLVRSSSGTRARTPGQLKLSAVLGSPGSRKPGQLNLSAVLGRSRGQNTWTTQLVRSFACPGIMKPG